MRAAGRASTRAADAFVAFARGAARVIVRWGLHELPGVLDELGATTRTRHQHRWLTRSPGRADRHRAARHAEVERVAGARARRRRLLALGGGSAIDTAKAVSAQTGLPLVSIPTTYSGAEWTAFFGVRDADRRMRGGGAGAHPAGIVYEPQLTLDLPRAETAARR